MFKYGNLKIYTFAWVKFDFIEFIGIKLMCGKEDLKQWYQASLSSYEKLSDSSYEC